MTPRSPLSISLGTTLLLVAVQLLLPSPSFLAGASSIIKLRGSNLTIIPAEMEPRLEDINTLAAAQFSVVASGTAGLVERAEYTAAYIDPETLELVGGVNPLDSFSTVEANNSFLWVNDTNAYQALEILLYANNTMEVSGPNTTLYLNRSSLRGVANNWLLQSNGGVLDLTNSSLLLTDYFTWWANNAGVALNGSVVALNDFILYFNSTTLTANKTSIDIRTSPHMPPARYDEKIFPLVALTNDTIELFSSSWTLEDMPHVHFDSSALSLTNSTLTIKNSTVHMYASALALVNSQILAYNSTVVLLSDTTTLPTLPVTSIEVFKNFTDTNKFTMSYNETLAMDTNATAELPPAAALLGFPLGRLDASFIMADADIHFEDGL